MKKTNAIRLLTQKKIEFKLLEYTYLPDNLSLSKIADDNNLQLHQVYKTLVLKGDKTGVVVALVAGDKSLDLKKFAAVSGNKKVTLLAVKELQKYTGYIRGGCSPIGMKKNYEVYISEEAKTISLIYINAGARGLLVGLAPLDLPLAIDVKWASII
ncbi:MAG: Cys-tRNA(Pro) deacylase [Saprospiraceae bacterium]|nr:Cys-tRNA(Pro) deacylase [Saprospiraceae bacterium]